MVFQKTVSLMFFLVFSINSWAETILIKPRHPEQYTVQKEDTLWDIASQFLENPRQWPLLWEHNAKIENPDLVYEGDTLYFYRVDGKPQLRRHRIVDLKPRIRISTIEASTKVIPTDAISQFLISPKIVDHKELAQSPYVIGFAGEHILAGAGDRIYVKSITAPESLSYTIYRKGEVYISPESHEILGYEAQYIADATIERAGDPATLSIIKSNREILKGDRLMVSDKGELALNYFPHPPEKLISGSIISVLDGVSQIGQHNIVVIDKGLVDGLETGHTLDIYQRGKWSSGVYNSDTYNEEKDKPVKLPDELAGVLMVFRPFERLSYALVIEATQTIHLLDRVQTP